MATEKRPSRPPSRSGGARPPARRPKPTPAETAERVAKKLDDKLSRATAHLERKAEQLDRKASQLEKMSARIHDRREMIESISSHLGALDVWTRSEPGGRRPRFSRDEIAAAAVRIADTEGFDALSMRRLATELGAGTMTLYHYIRTKDELLALLSDTVMGEVILPPGESLPEDWRAAMGVIAHRSRAALVRHPWMFDITDDPPVGPNSVRHFDQTLEAVGALDIPLEDKLDIASTVDSYVFGFCLQERNGLGDEDLGGDAMRRYVTDLLATGEYPALTALVERYGLDETWAAVNRYFSDGQRFERGLSQVLDGIEAGLPDPS